MTRDELQDKMAVLLGGRAGMAGVWPAVHRRRRCLAKVTDIARAMVTGYGMSERLGHIALEREPQAFLANDLAGWQARHDYSPNTATAIDEEIRALIDHAFARSLQLLEACRALLERAARQLLATETLDATALQQLVTEAV